MSREIEGCGLDLRSGCSETHSIPVCGNVMPNGLSSSLDFQGYMQGNNQETPFGVQEGVIHSDHATDVFCFGVGSMQELPPFPVLESSMDERLNHSADDNICQQAVEGGVEENFGGKGKDDIIWHRTKWSDEMVKVLITAVSYVGEDDSSPFGDFERRKLLICPKKGKWRAISDVMVERGYYVSPQQCEDKFNDLNKKYKRLNAILGKGTTCDVVENPVLMESMDLSNELKEEVKKLLSCKQLFYQQMCSYHNGNRLFLPHDLVLQQSLISALKGKANCEYERLVQGVHAKRMRPGGECDALRLDSPSKFGTFNTSSDSRARNESTSLIGVNSMVGERAKLLHEQLVSRSLKIQEEKLKLQEEMLELERKRIAWLRYSQQKDRELQERKLKLELMKLENDRLAFQLKHLAAGANEN